MAEGLQVRLDVWLEGAALRAVRRAHVDDRAARPYPVALDQAGDARAGDHYVGGAAQRVERWGLVVRDAHRGVGSEQCLRERRAHDPRAADDDDVARRKVHSAPRQQLEHRLRSDRHAHAGVDDRAAHVSSVAPAGAQLAVPDKVRAVDVECCGHRVVGRHAVDVCGQRPHELDAWLGLGLG